jgi:hypothetical protein
VRLKRERASIAGERFLEASLHIEDVPEIAVSLGIF